MGQTLIITEKPSVAREYAKILGASDNGDGYISGNGYVISWCIGHLVEMSYPDAYDEKYGKWNLDDLPFLPETYKYEVIEDVKKQFLTLKQFMNDPDIDTIYYGGDSGREGEYIGRLVRMLAGVRPGIEEKRIWIDSFTEAEIKKGIAQAKPLSEYDNLYYAADERSKEDYATGINFTRALTLAYRGFVNNKLGVSLDRPITVGRVMTCVLAMVVNREREIRSFVPKDFFKIKANMDASGGKLSMKWKVDEKSSMFGSPKLYSEEGFLKEEDADAFKNMLAPMVNISEVSKTMEKKNAPFLYSLAELQGDCTKLFKMGPDETLATAQSLYEKKLTTYPRTDARVLSSAVAAEIDSNIKGLSGYKDAAISGFCQEVLTNGSYRNIGNTQYTNDSKITDHYAIIPTGDVSNAGSMSSTEKQVFELICKRFLSIFYPPAVYAKIAAKATALNGTNTETFSVSARSLQDEGYFKVAGAPKQDDDAASNFAALATLSQGMSLPAAYATEKGTTQPPKRYTSGSMVLAMENAGNLIEEEELRAQIKGSGVGTSATRAETISKLIKLGYIAVEKKSQALSSTEIGETIYDVVNDVLPDLLSPRMTASWEKGLEQIAAGTLDRKKYDDTIRAYVQKGISAIKEKATSLPPDQRFTSEPICKCPVCGRDIIKGKSSYFCLGYKETDEAGNKACTVGVQGEICGAKITADDAKILFGGGTVTKKMTSKEKNKTWNQRLKFNAEEKKVVFDMEAVQTNYKCPACKKNLGDTGNVLECSCGVKIWKIVAGKTLSGKDLKDLFEKKKTGLIKGLKKKAGGTFDAYLVLQDDGKISYEFPPRN